MMVGYFTGTRYLKVAPDYGNIFIFAPQGFVVDALKEVALHVYGIDMTGIFEYLRYGHHVRAATSAEIGHLHALLYTKHRYIAVRVRKTACGEPVESVGIQMHATPVRRVIVCSLLHLYKYNSKAATLDVALLTKGVDF